MELKFLTRESITEMKADDEKFIPMLISENRDDMICTPNTGHQVLGVF